MKMVRRRYEAGGIEINLNEAGDALEVMQRQRHKNRPTPMEMRRKLHSLINPSVGQSTNIIIGGIREGYQTKGLLLE
ncbi:MAG: hypothetical protein ACM3O8_02125 [Methylococcaceae bacterium]